MTRVHVTLATVLIAAAFAFSTTLVAQARPEVALRAAIEQEEAKGDIKGAIEQYRKLAENRDRAVAAQALLRLGQAYQNLGDGESKKVYERLVREFGDQPEANATARARLQAFASAVGSREQSARRVWAGAAWGRLSSDGRYLTHGANSGDLVLADVTTKTTRRLTNSGGWVVSGDYMDDSVISPDGRQVGYTWFIEAEDRYELRVVSTATADPRPRTAVRLPKGEWIGAEAWTPDATRLVVKRELARGTWQLGIVAVSDGSYKSLKSLEWRDPGRLVSMSPDGRFIAYTGQFPDNGSPRDILVLALDGSQEATAVTGPADDFDPLWAPDGSHLVFMSNRTGSNGLWAVPMRDGRPAGSAVLLKADVGSMDPMGITRGGSLYYVAPGNARQDVYVAPLDGYKVTKAPTRVGDQFVNANSGPAWSPDGETLAYYSMRGRPTLVLRSMKNGQERTVALPQGLINSFQSGPRWFPDGRALLILARSPQGAGVGFFRFNIESGNSELLHQAQRARSVALAPDGKTIFFATAGDESADSKPGGRLMRFDISTRQEIELKRDTAAFPSVAVSPDGTQLAYVTTIRENRTEYPSILQVMPTSGGSARQLLRDPIWLGPNRFNTLAWTPDQKNLIVMRDDSVLWRIPLDGTAPQPMGLRSDAGSWRPDGSVTPKVDISITGRFKSPAIHPDGKTLAFSLAQSDPGEIWALENFLPPATARK